MQTYPLVTIVGGSGFVGRHTVKAFTNAGWRVRVLCRDTVRAEFLKTAGYPGQVVLDHADITRPETIAGKMAGSDVVVNLVSILYESGRQKFDAINVAGAKNVAEEAAKAKVKRFIQISALGIAQSDAQYASTKRIGEESVRAAFPAATILRPSLIIGPEDGFFQRFGRMSMISPVLPLIAGGTTKFQPVIVTDVAQAIFNAATQEEALSKTYEVAGPVVYDFKQLLELLRSITRRTVKLISIPTSLAMLKGFFCELLPFAPLITRDQVRMLAVDSIADKSAPGLTSLGITPQPIADALPAWLTRYVKA